MLNFHEYQKKASETAIYPERNTIVGLMYCGLGLTGESGEVAEKIKKYFRDGMPTTSINFEEDWYRLMEKEIGDVLWYLSQICAELGLELQTCAEKNLIKLANRQAKGTIHGSGDTR